MFRLIKTNFIRYFRSPFLIFAFSCSLILGIIHGVIERKNINIDFDYFFNESVWLSSHMSDIWYICNTWVVIVFISLEIGREFSEGTIRNKLYIGHTRIAIFLSEIISGCVMTFFSFLLFMIPTVIGGKYFFLTLSPTAFFALLGELLLFFLVWGIFSAVLTMLIANRAFGVVAVFSVMLFLAIINVNLRGYYYNTAPSEITRKVICFSEDGNPYAVEQTTKNEWYIDGLPKVLVNVEHEANPFSRSYNVCNYEYIHYPEKAKSEDFELQAQMDWQVKYDSFVLILTGAILIVGGSVLFLKKDLK